MFCGPIMDYSSSWIDKIPGGNIGHGMFAFGMGVLFIMQLSYYLDAPYLDWCTALYCTMVVGTTVGYGDCTPHTDVGRLSTALL